MRPKNFFSARAVKFPYNTYLASHLKKNPPEIIYRLIPMMKKLVGLKFTYLALPVRLSYGLLNNLVFWHSEKETTFWRLYRKKVHPTCQEYLNILYFLLHNQNCGLSSVPFLQEKTFRHTYTFQRNYSTCKGIISLLKQREEVLKGIFANVQHRKKSRW